MMSRLFKKKGSKKAPAKKAAPVKTAPKAHKPAKKPEPESQKILTAEGWKRMMMKKYSSKKSK